MGCYRQESVNAGRPGRTYRPKYRVGAPATKLREKVFPVVVNGHPFPAQIERIELCYPKCPTIRILSTIGRGGQQPKIDLTRRYSIPGINAFSASHAAKTSVERRSPATAAVGINSGAPRGLLVACCSQEVSRAFEAGPPGCRASRLPARFPAGSPRTGVCFSRPIPPPMSRHPGDVSMAERREMV
jgi:hypothetical protein